CHLPPPTSTLFPYTTLFRSNRGFCVRTFICLQKIPAPQQFRPRHFARAVVHFIARFITHFIKRTALDQRFDFIAFHRNAPQKILDRKSTRLNSSHVSISYAV